MKCSNCGMEITGNANVCPNCGNQLNNIPINNQNIQNNQYNQNTQYNNGYNNQMVNNQMNQNYSMNNNQMMNNNMYGNQNYNMNYNNTNANSNGNNTSKFIIVGLLGVLLLLLGVVAIILMVTSTGETGLKDGSRTIMIYMVGSNLESDNKIATYDLDSIDPDEIDLDKINILLYTGGTSKWHNFVQNDENALYKLTEDGFEKLETYEKLNMGDASTLESLLNYGYENYETQYYDLLLYNHGGAIEGAIYDDFTNDNLSLEDFNEALENSPFNGKNKLNTVLFRTCLNGTVEVANVFAPYADYLIASEEVTNGGNSSVLNFLNEIDVDDDGISYGKKYISAYEKQIEEIDPFGFGTMPMYSIVDLSKIGKVVDLLSEFIDTVDIQKNYSDIVKIRSKLYQYGYTSFNISDYDTVDLYTLVEKLEDYAEGKADKLLDAIDDAIVYNWSKQSESHGLSVYFPYKASKLKQSSYLKVYKNLDENSSYYKFIGKFNNLSTSKQSSAFAKASVNNNETVVSSKEFSLQLTDEQKNDYAESIYMIFKKDKKSGLYNPIYSSDNTTLTDDGLLKTNLSNNLIKLRDVSDPGFEEYLTVIERNAGNKKTLLTSAVLYNFSSENTEDWKTVAATVYFDVSGDEPKIANYVDINAKNGVAGNIINPDEYLVADFISSSYNILDKNGNYTDDWDNNDIITAYELKIKDISLKRASLDDKEDYYCIFKILDIYGNEYYSNLLSIK